MSVTSTQPGSKINAGSIPGFASSLSTLYPETSACSQRYAYDQYGREADPNTIDAETCPGYFAASNRIEVENSLRPYLSAQYYNLPSGISGGSDTLFGSVATKGRLATVMSDQGKVLEVSDLTGGNTKINGDMLLSKLGTKVGGTQFQLAEGAAPAGYIRRNNFMY